jgi:hypothetical protein
MIAQIVAVAAGIWLVASPAVLGYGDSAAANDRIFGPIGASFAFVAIWEVVRSLRWATLPVGLWLILAPFVLGYPDVAAVVSSVLVGLVFSVTAFLGKETRQVYGGGWTTLRPSKRVPDERLEADD